MTPAPLRGLTLRECAWFRNIDTIGDSPVSGTPNDENVMVVNADGGWVSHREPDVPRFLGTNDSCAEQSPDGEHRRR